jgi:hypothetical protein
MGLMTIIFFCLTTLGVLQLSPAVLGGSGELLLDPALTVILGSKSLGTHDRTLLSQYSGNDTSDSSGSGPLCPPCITPGQTK